MHNCYINLDDHVIHARHEMRILKRQVGLVALHFGSLDYQRPSQVLCQVIRDSWKLKTLLHQERASILRESVFAGAREKA